MPGRRKAEARRQVAALPLRRGEDGVVRVLLVTSRTTKRWILPKGWPMKGLKDHQAAAVEAEEEAGVRGRTRREPVGRYRYWRRAASHFEWTEVEVFVLRVEKRMAAWKERDQRRSAWVPLADADLFVEEPQLGSLLIDLAGDEAVAAFLDAPSRGRDGEPEAAPRRSRVRAASGA